MKITGSNGVLRRITLSTANCSGLCDVPRIPCSNLNHDLSEKVLAMHTVFRTFYPQNLKIVFGDPRVRDEDAAQNTLAVCIAENRPVQDADLSNIFTGIGSASSAEDSPKLSLLKQYARTIAEKYITEKDSNVKQLTRNLISLIAQKSAEMRLVYILITETKDGIRDYFSQLFTDNDGKLELEEIDIQEGAHLIETSRAVFKTLVDSEEFEDNFCKRRSRIPTTFFKSANSHLSIIDKADIFALRYIGKGKGQAKNVKQRLGKNNSFNAFGQPLNAVLTRLQRRKFLEIVDTEEVDAGGRLKKKFKVSYDEESPAHTEFLEKFQALYPGETISSINQ